LFYIYLAVLDLISQSVIYIIIRTGDTLIVVIRTSVSGGV